MNDPFMTSEPIPKTMPRSTLACPPAKNFTDQLKNSANSQSQARFSSQLRENEGDKQKLRNDSSDKGFGLKSSNLKNDNFGSSASNFRPSSKDFKGPQSSNKNLNANFNSAAQSSQKKEKGSLALHSEIHVKKWVDYSTKYGLGYLLSDGSTGVYFNDSTKIILDKAG